jgi:phosphomannomutase
MNSIFKEYDIRGEYGTELTEDIAYKIGKAFVTFLRCRKVAVGRDVRTHSKSLFEALTRGIMEMGADVINLGECSSPQSYFGNTLLGCDAGIMITASHNPKKDNGFKLSKANAEPINSESGIKTIAALVESEAFAPVAKEQGLMSDINIETAYRESIQHGVHFPRRMRIAADCANGMGVVEARALQGLPLDVDALFDVLDGTFPNHDANPLEVETLKHLQDKVRAGQYDFGVAFDGDGDRVGFVDENGDIVRMDVMTAIMAQDILREHRGAKILYDLRSSWTVKEVIEKAGGVPIMCRVGHTFIKQEMRHEGAVFAGELSGHYYFRTNTVAENAAKAVITVANIISRSGKTLSQIVATLPRYDASGEINTEFADKDKAHAMMETLWEKFGAQGRNKFKLDGVSVEFDTWWFNVRCSNTESLLRLNVEATTAMEMIVRCGQLLEMIRS